MPVTEERNGAGSRLDVKLQDLLRAPSTPGSRVQTAEPLSLPAPVSAASRITHDDLLPSDAHGAPDTLYARRWTASQVLRCMGGWLFPYVKSRVPPGDFHPIIAYLFTEWKCNLDCHYCWAFDNSVKGMTEDMARRPIDWLDSTTCRVLALMGGEPLLRPDFAHKVVY
jgi:sulfatase maturation enzyme AslB (radical SAM superfamily)